MTTKLKKLGKFKYQATEDELGKTTLKPVMKCADGSMYVGYWNGNLRCGKGIIANSDGSYYQGNWENDMKNGKGRMIYYDECVYSGDW